MSEPRVLGPTDRATIRERWHQTCVSRSDVLALLDTCDAMANVIRRQATGWHADTRADGTPAWRRTNFYPPQFAEMSPAEAAVLHTTPQDTTHG